MTEQTKHVPSSARCSLRFAGSWKHLAGEILTVVDVDEDGDFKLRNTLSVQNGTHLRMMKNENVVV